ncbi:F-box only protein 6 [Cucurbita maxima]|uniref:F-box only protein 6 n=1 Tax=Cucurbita maxima TaxID=3661 RepID=A0A6J1KTQ0_CUCMA|nr:F-box only protein 6 [Cucurbita maxima]
MEGLAMLRQLIGQLQELLQFYHSHPPPPPAPPAHHQLPLTLASSHQRWCFKDIDDNSADDFYGLVIAAGRSGNCRMTEACVLPPVKKPRKERNRGKLSGSAAATEAMDEEMWKDFPEDLFEAVIARLPIATFFRFRAVCQKWNSLLNSETFALYRAQVPQTTPWFYTITHDMVSSGAIYDPSSNKWYHPSISSQPVRLLVLPVASAGGLVCLLDFSHKNFFVCNPLTRSFKELPARSVELWSRVAVGMTLNGSSASGGYKILCLGCDGEYEVYDSIENSWTHPRSMPSTIKLPLTLKHRSQAVSIDNFVYFMRSDPEGIMSYNMVTGIWNEFIVPSPRHLTDHTLADFGGRLMLVGLLTKNAATCVCIWELQKMTLLWKEVDRMPNIWCLEFYGKHVRMNCLGNKGLLMLSLRSRQMNRLVTYDVTSKEWLKVPVLPRGRKRQWITSGTAFYPCPTAVA